MSNPKIVIVEDEKSIRDMYVMKLKSFDFKIAEAADGEEGLKVIEEFRPDLILLDLRMPCLSGQDMLKKLRGQEWGADVLVIILTNLSQSEASMDLRFMKVDKYIVKAHSTPKQVLESVVEVLKRHNKIADVDSPMLKM